MSDIAAMTGPLAVAASRAVNSVLRPARTDPVTSSARVPAGKSSAACTVAAFNFSWYGGSVVANKSVRGVRPSCPASAARAASTAIVTVFSS